MLVVAQCITWLPPPCSWHVYSFPTAYSVVPLWCLICWQVFRYVLYVLVNYRAHITPAAEDQETGHRHAGEEWSFPGVESAGGGDVCAAAPELCRFALPAASPERADRGAAQAGRPDAGAVTELQAAGRSTARGPCRGWRDEESPAQKKKPGGSSNVKSRWEGHADAADLLHGSCKTSVECGLFLYEGVVTVDRLLYFWRAIFNKNIPFLFFFQNVCVMQRVKESVWKWMFPE